MGSAISAFRNAAKDVAAADDHCNLYAQSVDGLYLFGYSVRHVHVNAVALLAHQRLARQLEQDSPEGRSVSVCDFC